MVFNFSATIRAEQKTSFSFESEDELKNWVLKEFKNSGKYKGLPLYIKKLDDLKVGDECYVGGGGEEKLTITKIEKNQRSEHVCHLNNGKIEKLSNCYKNWKVENLPKSLIKSMKECDFNKVHFQDNYILIED